jgi:phage terminase small subunit
MATLKNKRHELMAQGLAKGLTQTEAYIKAGYSKKSANSAACMLLKNQPEIQARTEQILERKQQMAQASTNQAIKNVAITKEYVLRAAMDTLEIALGRKKVKRTRSQTYHIKTAQPDQPTPEQIADAASRGETLVAPEPVDGIRVATADFDAYAVDLPVAGKMVELLGRDVNLFVETKRIQTGPLDAVPQDQVEEALAIINAAIAAGEAKALAEESGGAGSEPRPSNA